MAKQKIPDASDRPNILWICTDQQCYDTIHALGNEHIQTPNLDRLVREGVSFTHAHCQSPSCTPSRASFLTGLYPNTVHCTRNGNAYFPTNERVQPITKRLADVGYHCGLAGKLHIASAYSGEEARMGASRRTLADVSTTPSSAAIPDQHASAGIDEDITNTGFPLSPGMMGLPGVESFL